MTGGAWRTLRGVERIDEKQGKVCYKYGEGAEEVERMDCLEFIARVTSHIPDKRQVTVRYVGLYANAHRGKVRKREAGEHKLILLKLTFIAERPPPPQVAFQELLMAAESSAEYLSSFSLAPGGEVCQSSDAFWLVFRFPARSHPS